MAKLMVRIRDAAHAFRNGHPEPSRELEHATDVESDLSQARMVRVETRANLARRALYYASVLSKDEETHLQAAPLGEARFKMIVDSYAVWVALEVGQ